jgi:hypothetical protein
MKIDFHLALFFSVALYATAITQVNASSLRSIIDTESRVLVTKAPKSEKGSKVSKAPKSVKGSKEPKALKGSKVSKAPEGSKAPKSETGSKEPKAL